MTKFKAVAMARGTVYVDENLRDLEPYLRAMNLHVHSPDPGMKDKEIAQKLLTNRIFITNNSKDFMPYASSYDIGIIATEKVTKDPGTLADIIFSALIKFKLWSLRHGFVLRLQKDGKHKLEPLTD